jgi:hypothetical protein
MGPFRRGYEKILQGTEAPIIPMHLSGLWKHPLSPTPAPWFPWRRWEVTISIGQPLPGSTPPEELQRQVLRLIEQTLVERFREVARRERDTVAVGGMTYGVWWQEARRRQGGRLAEVKAADDREYAVAVMAAVLAMGDAPVVLDGVAVRQQDLLATIESAAMFGTPAAGRLYELLFAMAMGRPWRRGEGKWLVFWEMGGPVACEGKPLLGVTRRVDGGGILHVTGPGREAEWNTGRRAAEVWGEA